MSGSLTIWFEERETWTAESLRMTSGPSGLGDIERDFGGLRIL
jgi:hypothetical protein